MLVVDERTRDTFDGTPHELESYFYGWSIFDCLPAGRAASPSAATGTVMRPDTLRGYAEDSRIHALRDLADRARRVPPVPVAPITLPRYASRAN